MTLEAGNPAVIFSRQTAPLGTAKDGWVIRPLSKMSLAAVPKKSKQSVAYVLERPMGLVKNTWSLRIVILSLCSRKQIKECVQRSIP